MTEFVARRKPKKKKRKRKERKQKKMAAAQNPPRTLNVQKLAESRGPEIDSLHYVVSNRLSGDFRVRRSDRRRTTSHLRNRSKRRRREEGHDEAAEKGEKKVCRRERRRRELTSNPELGFSVAGDCSKRLRTHVWHAKRFTMVKRWGFYLPLGIQGRGRGSRAVMKWLQNGALVHDASYYFPIQLEGPEDSILSILRRVVLPFPQEASESSSENYHNVLDGTHCRNAMLYHVGSSTSHLVAPVTHMWRHIKSESDASSDNSKSRTLIRQLWIWIHTAAFEEGLDVLKRACEEQQVHESGVAVSCFAQEGRIARLEVVGTKASHLIQKLLHPIIMSDEGTSNHPCLVRCNASLAHKILTFDQLDKIQHGAIVPLTVKDPRQVSSETSTEFDEIAINLDSLGKCDPSVQKMLWDPCCKIDPPMPENVLCKEKNKSRLRSLFLEPTNQDVPHGKQKDGFIWSCPVILLKHAKDSTCLGWSIILPLSWVKTFWHCMVSSGAHAIGLRERHWVAWKNNIPCFPYDFPDTKAYSAFMANEVASTDASAQFRPPSMRSQKIPMPPPWDCIAASSHHMQINPKSSIFDLLVPRTIGALKERVEKMDSDMEMIDCRKEKGSLCFVRVLIWANKEGLFDDGDVVCAPNLEDLSGWNVRSGNRVEEYQKNWQLQLTPSSVESYFTQLESGEWGLQVPKDSAALEYFRWPIGFITTGFVHACNERVAVGFCDIKILATLRRQQYIQTQIERPEIFVLVRNIRSAAYRRAVATVILEQQKEDLIFM